MNGYNVHWPAGLGHCTARSVLLPQTFMTREQSKRSSSLRGFSVSSRA